MTLAVDQRPRARLWERNSFALIDEARVPTGERPIATIQTLFCKSGLFEAVATTDWHDGSRWSGFVYLDRRGVRFIHLDELKKLVEWPEFDNYGPGLHADLARCYRHYQRGQQT